MYWCAIPYFQTFRLPCYKTERVYLPTFPRPSGKCSTTHPCVILLVIFFLRQSYASISFPLCSCFSKLQQVSKVQNIWFLSPLVQSKWENLAFSVSILFEESVLIFQFLSDKMHNYVKQNITVNFIIQKLKNKHIFLKKYINWESWGTSRQENLAFSVCILF